MYSIEINFNLIEKTLNLIKLLEYERALIYIILMNIVTRKSWKGKSELKPNVWGLVNEGGRITFNFISGTGTNQGPGYLAMILWSIIIMVIVGIILFFYSEYLSIVYLTIHLSFIIYWTIIREIKYYQLAKHTTYEIDCDSIMISYNFWGLKKELKIPLKEINQIHLIRYQQGDNKKGSIWIYTINKVKAYHVAKKERSNIARIEMISDYLYVYNLLNRRIN